MDKYNSIENDFQKTPNLYPYLSANISNEQQLRLNKLTKLKIIFWLRLEKEN